MVADSRGDIDPNTSPVVRQPTGRLTPAVPSVDTSKNAKLPTASNSTESPVVLERPTATADSAKESTQPEATAPAPSAVNRAAGNEATVIDSNEQRESTLTRRSSRGSRGRRSRRETSFREPDWNEIDVDGLPIRDADDSADDEFENDVPGTRFRDVFALFTALAFSLLLSQVSLWWFVGIDPLGLGPVVSGWAPSVVPGDFSK